MAKQTALKDVSLPELSKPAREPVPTEEQTTLRIARELQEQLKMVAVWERTTIMDLTDRVVRDWLKRYETATGRALPRRKAGG